ncbi:ABC transporter permease [Streptomyces sp. DASNCL29]|uniref:ABC transporter permease n=1 Tax=Streptomyces sp. DASNCL29 TaxID=2583819 RepID=UPI00110F729B|nr:ABC transporter permease [Streptomyces sp. DASNCL29]TMU94193.1 ABC transporter permease [Streptomyces sp. DASNCL29]
MLRTALRNVLAHKARLLMTVLAVMLGVAFVAGTLVFTNTISDAYQKSSQKGFKGVDVAISPDKKDDDSANPGDAPRLSQRLLDQASKVPGATSAFGVVKGSSALADKKGDLLGSGFSNLGGNYYPGSGGKDPRYNMTEGRAPKAAGEIALDSRTAERGHYKAGDSIRVSVDGPVRTEKVVGVFTTDDGNVAAGGTLALYDTATAQKLFGKPGQFDEIDVKAAAGTSQSTLKSSIDKILPEQAKATTAKKLAKDQAKAIEEGMSSMQTAMLVFAGIALFVGIFIIVNTFSMLVAQRTRELALMRAVGATRRQVTRSVLIEATVVGAVAAVVGLAAGVGIGAVLRSVLNSTGANVPDGPLIVAPTTVLASVVVGVVVTVLSAWLPGRRAAKIPPVAAMNSVHAAPTTRGLVLRNTIGSILAAAGAALVVAGAGMGDDGQGPMAFGAAAMVIGIFVLTPLLSRPLIAAAGPVLRIFGMPGKLARQNAVRNPRRTAATASALMVGLTLITGMTVIAGSMQKGIDKMAADGLRSDYVVSMGGGGATGGRPLSPEVSKTLAKLPEVSTISPLRTSPARIAGDSDSLTGVDPKAIKDLVNVDFTEGSFAALGGTKALIDDKIADEHHWKVGSTIPVTYEDGRSGKLTVGGVYEGNQMIRGVMVDNATVTPHMTTVADFQVMLKTKGGATENNKDLLKKTLGENPAIKIQNKQDISDEIASAFTLMLNMLYGLLAMAVIVAVLGVINTLAMSVFERSKEIGMLRAIGLDRGGVKRMVRLESLVISLFGGVLGLGLGVFFGWAAGELIATALPSYELVLPWARMGLFLLMAALVGIIAALWPARRASKLNMLAAIKAE